MATANRSPGEQRSNCRSDLGSASLPLFGKRDGHDGVIVRRVSWTGKASYRGQLFFGGIPVSSTANRDRLLAFRGLSDHRALSIPPACRAGGP